MVGSLLGEMVRIKNIVFMGSAEFGLPVLKRLISDGYNIKGIVSTPPSKKGRGLSLVDSPIFQYAKSELMPVFTPSDLSDQEFINNL